MKDSPSRRRVFAGVALVPATVLLALLTACAGSPDAAESPSDVDRTAEEWQLQYAACMREQGIDMPDEGLLSSGPDTAEAMTAATETCVEELGKPPVGSGEANTDEDSLTERLQAAQCFRDRGYDVDDPQPNEPITLPDGVSSDDLEACAVGSGSGAGPVTSTGG